MDKDEEGQTTAEYALVLLAVAAVALALTTWAGGGKITTFRYLAEEALKKLAPSFPKMGSPWTCGATLPGGDFAVGQRDQLSRDLSEAFPFLDPTLTERLVATYGTVAQRIFSGATTLSDLGVHFGFAPQINCGTGVHDCFGAQIDMRQVFLTVGGT